MDILTAIDKALQTTEPDNSPLITATVTERDRVTGGTQRMFPPELLRDGRAIPFSPEGIAEITASWPYFLGRPIVTEADLVPLRKSEAEMHALLESMKKYSLSNVSKHIFDHRDLVQAAVLAGNETSVPVLASRDSVSAHFRSSQRAIESKLIQITHRDVLPIATGVVDRFDLTLQAFARDREIQERAECHEWGIEFLPSAILQSASSMLISLRFSRIPKPWAWSLPSSILAGICEL